MELWGIDVSHYQGAVNWSSVRAAGAAFAFAKATEGTATADPQFRDHWSGMKAASLLRGAYHYGHPGRDAATQAVFFHSVVGDLTTGDLPPVLDIETADGHAAGAVLDWVLAFVHEAEALFGRQVMIYTGGFWKHALGDPVVTELASRPLWLASHRATAPVVPRTWPAWTFWQYTDGQVGNPGPVPGVRGPCDRSRFAGDLTQLEALAAPANQPARASAATALPTTGVSPAPAWPGRFLIWPSPSALPPEQVRSFQARMNALGFQLAVDGKYGPACKAACASYQRENGLPVDGIVGPATWSALFDAAT